MEEGADLITPEFKKVGTNFIPETEWVKFIDLRTKYPDATTVFEFNVRYNVFVQRNILVALYTPEPEDAFVQNNRLTVDEGSDTAHIVLWLDSPPSAATAYKIFAAVRSVGDNWQTNIVTQTLYASISTLPAETLAYNSLPEE